MRWTHSWQCRSGESACPSRVLMTTSEPARSPGTWTAAPRSSAGTHEDLPESSSLSSSCPSFQSSFLSRVTSDFHVIKLNFVLFGKSSFWERVFRVALLAGMWGWEPPYPAVQTVVGRSCLAILQCLVATGAAGLSGCRAHFSSALSLNTGCPSDSEPPCHMYLWQVKTLD